MKNLIVFISFILFWNGASSQNKTSLIPVPGETYIISAWASQSNSNDNLITYTIPKISVRFYDYSNNPIPSLDFTPSGNIIDGWQKIEGQFTIPLGTVSLQIVLYASNDIPVYYDDIRFLPVKSNMKSFVYSSDKQRLMAELDENNYATFYEYDLEGGLIRVKKETEKGVFTIQETRSSSKKNGEN